MVELLREAAHEITGDPMKFIIELVQFGILLFIVKAVAFGLGEKPGMLTNMLTERRERVRAQLEDAASANEQIVAGKQIVAERLKTARTEARRIVAEARRATEEERQSVLATVETEFAELREQAEAILDKERSEMLGGLQEQLIDLVTTATRQILDEGYTAAEQRELIQKSVMESLDELESVSLG